MTKKIIIAVIVVALLAAAVGGFVVYNNTYVSLGEVRTERDAETIDLKNTTLDDKDLEELAAMTQLKQLDLTGTGLTAAQYEALRAALPQCEILWELPFQGQYLSLDTQSVTVTSLTDEDVALLDYLADLRTVDGTGCTDYEQLMALDARRESCEVLWQVSIGGQNWAKDVEEILVEQAEASELEQYLPYLPQVKSVTISTYCPDSEAMYALREAYPQVAFSWKAQVCGVAAGVDDTEIDLTGASGVTAEALAEDLKYFTNLEYVALPDADLDKDAMLALQETYPGVAFDWNFDLCGVAVNATAEEIDLSGIAMDSVDEVEAALALLPNVKKIDMSYCGISNEDMDAFNRRYEDVQIVWTVSIGSMQVRTDADWVMPGKYNIFLTNNDCYNLRYCTELLVLDLGHMYINNCDFLAYMPHLKYLILADTDVTDITPLANCKELLFLEIFQTPIKDYSVFKELTALEDLNICYTYGDDVTPLTEMTWLKRLWFAGAGATEEFQAQLTAALPDTQLVFRSASSTGEGWRFGQRYYEMRDILGMYYMTE